MVTGDLRADFDLRLRAVTASTPARMRSCSSPLLPKDHPDASTYRAGTAISSITGPSASAREIQPSSILQFAICSALSRGVKPIGRTSGVNQLVRREQHAGPQHPGEERADRDLVGAAAHAADTECQADRHRRYEKPCARVDSSRQRRHRAGVGHVAKRVTGEDLAALHNEIAPPASPSCPSPPPATWPRSSSTDSAGLTVRSHSKTVEFTTIDTSGERVPLARREDQRWTGGILRVAHAHASALEEGDLYAILSSRAVAGLEPLGSVQVNSHYRAPLLLLE